MKHLLFASLISVFSLSNAFAATLNCGGTEPFWGLKVTDKMMTFSSPELEKPVSLKVISKTEAAGFTAGFAFVVKSKFSSLSVIAGECNDGMSDEVYSHHAIYENGGAVLAGCCNLK
ncbi:MAG: hypothetical protein K2P81_06700 [Bacteriovoracaceae bacterium]|nr:hypothetical protein [Bacteriovoracaceae bacterium]